MIGPSAQAVRMRAIADMLKLLDVPDTSRVRVGPLWAVGITAAGANVIDETTGRKWRWWATAPDAAIGVSMEEADALVSAGAERVEAISPYDSPTEI
jgi:hypothetical protein